MASGSIQGHVSPFVTPFNATIFEEVSVKAAGNSAEMPLPGVGLEAVVRSGGNEFHGRYSGAFERPWMQGSNISAEHRAQGLSQTTPLKGYYDASGDLGGRLVRDRLWFYGASATQSITAGAVGFAQGPGPDGVYLTADDGPGDRTSSLTTYAGKVSYQLSQTTGSNWAFLWGNNNQPEFRGNRLRPLEASIDLLGQSRVHKAEYQATLTENLLLDVVGGQAGFTSFFRQPPCDPNS